MLCVYLYFGQYLNFVRFIFGLKKNNKKKEKFIYFVGQI